MDKVLETKASKLSWIETSTDVLEGNVPGITVPILESRFPDPGSEELSVFVLWNFRFYSGNHGHFESSKKRSTSLGNIASGEMLARQSMVLSLRRGSLPVLSNHCDVGSLWPWSAFHPYVITRISRLPFVSTTRRFDRNLSIPRVQQYGRTNCLRNLRGIRQRWNHLRERRANGNSVFP